MKRLSFGPGFCRLPALLAFSLGCSEGTAPPVAPPVEACADDQSVALQVSAGTRPTFTWTPACGMASIMVIPVAGPPAAWVVYGGAAAASNPFRSGTRYGQSPPGTFEARRPTVLQVGTDYQVAIYRWVGEPGQPNQFGSATFRP
jgi:hypothetical protein